MKVAVYVVEHKSIWSVHVSLDLQVDVGWCSGSFNGSGAEVVVRMENLHMVILSLSMSLGWAVKLRDSFVYCDEMQLWEAHTWDNYVKEILKEEQNSEWEARYGRTKTMQMANKTRAYGWEMSIVLKDYKHARMDERGSDSRVNDFFISAKDLGRLEEEAELLSELISGRSLLEAELITLLSEGYPQLSAHWRRAAQLAYLQGRLKLEAAVAVPALLGHRPSWRGAIEPKPHKGRGDLPPSSIMGGFGPRVGQDELRSGSVTGGLEPRAGQDELSPRSIMGGLGPRAVGHLAGWTRAAAAWLPALCWRGAARRRALLRCLRCGSVATARTACAACGLAACAYCEACLALGRSRACALLLRSAALPAALLRSGAASDPTAAARRWGLSSAQAEAAGAALAFMAERRGRSACPERFLLWAVTGAGKTEMIFPLLATVLAAGGRVLVATPRRDVVLELAPRLAKAFPAESLAVLYGGSPDRWTKGRVTLATTHQLLRFHHAFDLVIIDELDAYPYHNDPMLAHAAEEACKKDGTFIYLSATPPQALQRQVKRGRLAHARVPVRYHGYPLPVPKHLTATVLNISLKRGALPKSLLQALTKSLARDAQIFIFVARIAHIEPLLFLLRRHFPNVKMAGTSSQDPARADKVNAFRQGEVSLLVTTTILERGVTIPRSDVYIMDADSSLFDEASLVQMAGRAGRSKEDPAGTVVFASPYWNGPQRGAVSQIRTMNNIARRKGFLSKGMPQ